MELASPNPDVPVADCPSLSPALRLESVRFAARRDDEQSSITLEVAPSEVVALVGPEKTDVACLLRCVAGLAAPVSGTIEIQGTSPRLGHEAVGISFADPMLLEWRTAIDNVLVQAQIRGMDMTAGQSRARHLLATAGLAGRENQKPASLSRGEAQRVSICRGLLHKPAVLLLGDFFLGLHALEREQLCYDLERLFRENRTAVLMGTSQISEAVLLSDRVVVFAGEPARVQAALEIELPHPRRWDDAQTARLTEITGRVRTLLHAHGALV